MLREQWVNDQKYSWGQVLIKAHIKTVGQTQGQFPLESSQILIFHAP